MDLIKINENKLKIMLTPTDMQCYDITTDEICCGNIETRRAFRNILEEARGRCGFVTDGSQIYVQLYPSREGGCEMFITKLGICESKANTPPLPSSEKPIDPRRALLPRPRALPSKDRDPAMAFAFESLDALTQACRRLHSGGMKITSTVYHGETGRYFLFLNESGHNTVTPTCGLLDRATVAIISEYGIKQNIDALRLYIREHARLILAKDAIEQLASM